MIPEVWRPSELRKMIGQEKAAAVCYRLSPRGIEFLLVRTRGGRWTFPKGSVEPGLTPAQSAALEAYEEAGVHGRMEKTAFAWYRHLKGGKKKDEMTVHAHLCEVLRHGEPREAQREPTWFSAEKAKRRLQQDRSRSCATELLRVTDLAVARILHLTENAGGDQTMRKVNLEAGQQPGRAVITVEARRWIAFRPPALPPGSEPAEEGPNPPMLEGKTRRRPLQLISRLND